MGKLLFRIRLIVLLTLVSVCICKGQWVNGGEKLTTSAAENHRPVISVTASGGMYVTWMSEDTITGRTGIFLTGINADGTLFPGLPTGGINVYKINNSYAPKVITAEDQSAIVAWYGYPTGSGISNILVQKYSPAGTPLWNSGVSPVIVSPDTIGIDKYPEIVSDNHNGVYIAWTRYTNLANPNLVDVYLQHIDSTGYVANGWNPSGIGVGVKDTVREAFPRLAMTPDESGVYVMYNEGLGSYALIIKKINTADGSKAGSPWPGNGVVLSPGPDIFPSPDREQYLFCDKDNNAVAFWLDTHYTDLNYEIYMQRITPKGQQLLAHPGGKYIGGKGIVVGGAYTGTMYLDVSRGEDDNFLLVFADYSDTTGAGDDVDAIKVKQDGSIIWQKNPITTTHSCDYQKVVSDGHKGMYIFYKGGGPYTLYALAVDSTGNFYPGCTEPGIAFGAIDNYDASNPNLDYWVKATCPGRAMVAWDRYRDNGKIYNIYGCNLLKTLQCCMVDNSPCVMSVSEIQNDADVTIYPNPFTNELLIQFHSPQSTAHSQNLIFRMYDIAGKMVLSSELGAGSRETIISLGWLSKGMYFYEVRQQVTGNGQQAIGNSQQAIGNGQQVLVKRGKLIKE